VSQRHGRNLFLDGEGMLTRVDHPDVVELQVADGRVGEASDPWRLAELEFEAESAPAFNIENSECQSEFSCSSASIANMNRTIARSFVRLVPLRLVPYCGS
jgi:hypothetical protein